MTHKLCIVSFNYQSFRNNKDLIHKLMEKCDVLLLHETLNTEYNSNELDLIAEGHIAMTYMPAKQWSNLSAGRPSDGLAVFWRSINNVTCKTLRYTDRIIGSTLETKYFKYVILNAYMNCVCGTLESLHEYQSCIICISNFISEETFDEIIIIWDMNCDHDIGRFFLWD